MKLSQQLSHSATSAKLLGLQARWVLERHERENREALERALEADSSESC